MQDNNKSLAIAKAKYNKKQPRLTFTFYPKDHDLYDFFCNSLVGETNNCKFRKLIEFYRENSKGDKL